jgi:hypothetical protein
MRISQICLIIVVALSGCPTHAEDVYSSMPQPNQPAPYGSSGAASQPLTSGPSSSDVYARPSVSSTVYPPATNPPASYPPANSTVYQQTASGQQCNNFPGSSGAASIPPDVCMPGLGIRLIESTWYTRIDYFHWNERSDGMDLVNEYGTLFTVGYMRRVGIERFHAAFFGATMEYKGFGVFDDGSLEPLSSATGYLGALAEYDLHVEPDSWQTLSLFVGVGTRFWIRDLKDGITDLGNPSIGYQETWWTMYPYLGLEKKRSLSGGPEFYYAGRIGCTAITYQHATWGDTALYPKAGLTGQLECGVRGRSAFISIFSEVLSWRQSDIVANMLQPNSQLFTIGLKTGFCF